MQRIHLHLPGWMHGHHFAEHLSHIIHDPRFWAGLALAVLFILMILTTIFSKGGQPAPRPAYPLYPYLP